jgi:hypothetical protein
MIVFGGDVWRYASPSNNWDISLIYYENLRFMLVLHASQAKVVRCIGQRVGNGGVLVPEIWAMAEHEAGYDTSGCCQGFELLKTGVIEPVVHVLSPTIAWIGFNRNDFFTFRFDCTTIPCFPVLAHALFPADESVLIQLS